MNLKDFKQAVATPQPPPPPQQPPKLDKSLVSLATAVSRQQLIKQRRTKRPPQVKYINADTSPESANRISRLKGTGKGKLLVIVGNGPSISEIELEKLRYHQRIEILSINKPDHRIWPTTYWAFFDLSQFRRHEDLWNGYNGLVFNSTAIKRQKLTSMQFKNISGKGWSRDLLQGLYIGRSSVFAAMQIAAWMEHEHVYIVGCDMHPDGVNGKLHFYGQNPDVDPAVRRERFTKEAEYYDKAAEIMTPDERARFTFCSGYNPWPCVDKFGKKDHRDAVEHILSHATRL